MALAASYDEDVNENENENEDENEISNSCLIWMSKTTLIIIIFATLYVSYLFVY